MFRKILIVIYSALGFALYGLAAIAPQNAGTYSFLLEHLGPNTIARCFLFLAALLYLAAIAIYGIMPFVSKSKIRRHVPALFVFVWLSLVPLYLLAAGYSYYLISSISEPRIHDIPEETEYWLSGYQLFCGTSNTAQLLYMMSDTNIGAQHNYNKAKWCLRRAVRILEHGKSENATLFSDVLRKLAYIEDKLGEDAESVGYYRRALSLCRTSNDQNTYQTRFEALTAIAKWDISVGEFEEAALLYQEAVNVGSELYGGNNCHTVGAVSELANADFELSKFLESEKLYERVIDYVQAQPRLPSGQYASLSCGKDEVNFPTILYRYSQVLEALHKNTEAQAALKRAHQVVDLKLGTGKLSTRENSDLSGFTKQVTDHLLALRYNTKDFQSAQDALVKQELAESALSQLRRFVAPQAMAAPFWLLGRWPTPKQEIQIQYTDVSIDPPKKSGLAGVHVKGNVFVKNDHALQKDRKEEFVFTYAILPAEANAGHLMVSHFWFVDSGP